VNILICQILRPIDILVIIVDRLVHEVLFEHQEKDIHIYQELKHNDERNNNDQDLLEMEDNLYLKEELLDELMISNLIHNQ
jgi:hypothetical protein